MKVQPDEKNTIYVTENIVVVPPATASGFTTLHNTVFSGTIIMEAAIPYEYYVYKTSGNLTQIKNHSGVIQYSGVDTGLVINHMLSGTTNNISIGFQPNYYSGTTDIQNNGRKNLRWYGNSARVGMKIRIDSSGDTGRASNNVFYDFFMSGSGAGFVFNNVYNPAIVNSRIDNCMEGVSYESSNLYTEFWRLSNVHFNNCRKSVVFKTPTGAGTGSYVNGMMDMVSFNNGVAPFTCIEVQTNTEISESKIFDTRFWFLIASGIGIHQQSGVAMSRTILDKPYFENLANSGDSDAIRIEPSAGAMYLNGRPVFAGAAFAHNILNSGNVWIGGLNSTWRQTNAVSIPAGTDTFSSSTTVVSTINDDFEGIPNIYIIVGGTFAAGETVTVELTSNAIHSGGTAASFTITKTYKFTGTYPLELIDYQNLTSSNFRYVISSVTARVKSSAADSTAAVTVVSLTGGTAFQSNPILSGLSWLGAMNSGANLVVGNATAPPATPKGYITVTISGVNMFMPYYISG